MALLIESLGYPIYMESDIEHFKIRYKKLNQCYGKVVIVTDQTVYAYYGDLLNTLADDLYIVESGEESKSIVVASEIISYLAETGVTRRDLLVAFGGGVIGDLVGFVASTYMRGIAWLSIPTTLLSQVDSSIGGKTGVNIAQGKNLMGSFYNPAGVVICTSFLETLDHRERQSGYGELLKYACLMGLDIEQMLEELSRPDKMSSWICMALQTKAALVAIDYKEKNERRYLNLGHTFGHAIESYSLYNIPHGVCVGLGIREVLKFQLYMHQDKALASGAQYLDVLDKALSALNFIEVTVTDWQRLLNFLSRDKKADQRSIHMVWFKLESDITRVRIEEAVTWSAERILQQIETCCKIEQVQFKAIEDYLNETCIKE